MDGIWVQVIGILAIGIAGALVIVVRGLAQEAVNFLKLKMGATQYEYLKAYAQSIVRDLEQRIDFSGEDGAKKKEAAMAMFQKFVEKMGWSVPADLMSRLIEEAVQIMNAEIDKIDFEPEG